MHLLTRLSVPLGKAAEGHPHKLKPLDSALMKKRLLNLLQSTLTKTLDLKSFRMNTYKKTGVRGVYFHDAQCADLT